jgi:hypothetical protein
MPRSSKPTLTLTHLRRYRHHQTDEAAAALVTADRTRAAAEKADELARARALEAAAHVERVRREEAERFARSELTAADLVQSEAWEQVAQEQLDAHARAEAQARQALAAAAAAEKKARDELGQKFANEQVVRRYERGVSERLERATEGKLEEEVAENMHAKRRSQ